MPSKTVTCNGSSGSKYNLTLNYSLNNQNIALNKSNVTVYITLKRNDGYANSAWNNYANQNSCQLSVAGSVRVNKPTLTIDTRNSKLVELARWTGDIVHDNNGALTIAMSGSFTIGNGPALTGGAISERWSLPTIPRASDFSLSAGSVIAGNSFNISISPKSNSYYHVATLQMGNYSQVLNFSAGETGPKTFSVPLNWVYGITNASSKVATVSVQTKSGNNNIGSSVSKSITINVPTDIKPSFTSLSLTRIDGAVPSSWGVYVQGYSKVRAQINGASGSYGSSISYYSILGDYYSSFTRSLTTGTLYSSGTVTFYGSVTDSRNRVSSVKSQSINVLPYNTPYLSSIDIYRCGTDGIENGNGDNLAIIPYFAYSSVSGKNTCTCAYDVTPIDQPSVTGFHGTCTNGIKKIINGVSGDYSWQVKITLQDSLSSNVYNRTIPTASVIMDFKSGGKGISFGKVAENDGFDVDMEAEFRKSTVFRGDTNTVGRAYFNQNTTGSSAQGSIYMDADMNICTDNRIYFNAPTSYFTGSVTASGGITASSDVTATNKGNVKLSECYCLGHPGQVIGEYEDLNYYTDVGTYICYTDAAAQKMYNCPYIRAFKLTVGKIIGTDAYLQQVYESYNGHVFKRSSINSGSSWSTWAYASGPPILLWSGSGTVGPLSVNGFYFNRYIADTGISDGEWATRIDLIRKNNAIRGIGGYMNSTQVELYVGSFALASDGLGTQGVYNPTIFYFPYSANTYTNGDLVWKKLWGVAG